MRLPHFLAELTAIAARVSPYAYTNVEAITLEPNGDVAIETGASDLEAEREDHKIEIAALQDSLDTAEKAQREAFERAEKAEKDAEQLREQLAELRDPESGASVLDYRDRTAEAEERVGQWREYVRTADQRLAEMGRELTAMRKRKGVEPGIMAHTWDVSGFINRVINAGEGGGLGYRHDHKRQVEYLQDEARKLRARIDATAQAGAKGAAKTSKIAKPAPVAQTVET